MTLEFVSNVLSMFVSFYLIFSTAIPLMYLLIIIRIDLESKAIVFQFELEGVCLIMKNSTETA